MTRKAENGELAAARAGTRVPLALARVSLSNFRSYEAAMFHAEHACVVLAGLNGTGKTNLLEAISLLSPGRGLRGAKLSEIQRKAPEPVECALWAVAATLSRPDGEWEIGTGLVPVAPDARERRVIHLNGAPAESADMAELLPMLWLTPAMDRLFAEGASGRRRFLDRLVFGLRAAHARSVARFERAMRERLRVLTEGPRDDSWLEGLEETMAVEGASITEARNTTIEMLNAELTARGGAGAFPCASLGLDDGCESIGADAAKLQAAFAASRMRDGEAGRTTVGPHLAELLVRHTLKRTDARDCSTGEQKALLISIVLANAWLQRKKNDGLAPVLLLDEIAAHLDAKRRAALFEEVAALRTQAWMTGTDMSLFVPLGEHARRYMIVAGKFVRAD
ncbi:MAG: DNA replication/repair protein RecF [Alphaproteobacteria bacterium]